MDQSLDQKIRTTVELLDKVFEGRRLAMVSYLLTWIDARAPELYKEIEEQLKNTEAKQ